jgi:hypothetical protein
MMNLQECRRLLIHYAHHNPKSSTFALLTGTTLTFATFVFAVSERDERLAREHHAKQLSSNTDDAHTKSISRHEAQVQAMIENARNSSWRQNLENAVDAQERFVLPNRHSNVEENVPEYLQRIDERSKEILIVQEEAEREKEKTTGTRFWR